MDEKCGYKTPTSADSLEQQIIDPSFPKNEREWWASAELARLRAENERLRAEPVEWRDHVEQRLHNWRQRFVNRSGDRLALDDMMSKESIDDLIDYVCDEWSDPVAPRQAEPVSETASHGCHYLAFPDRICNKCGQVHGYSRPPRPALDDAMYRVAIQQRNAAWAASAGLLVDVERLRAALEWVLVYSDGAKGFVADSVRTIAQRALKGE
jgi:hypothetical protein